MITNAQHALITKALPYDAIFKGLNALNTVGRLNTLEGSNGSVKALTAIEESVPAFNIPVKVYDALGKPYYCIDLRRATQREFTVDTLKNTYSPKLLTEANFLTHLALAEKVWNDRLADFSSIYYDACRIYATWIAVKLSKKLVLGIPEQTKLMIQFAYYFVTRPYRANRLNDGEYDMLVTRISNTFGYQATEVYTILDDFDNDVHANIDVFCKAVRELSDNPKMNKFSHVLLQTILIGSWFGGTDSRMLIALATEHPPTFLTILNRALNERTFKDTDITQITLRLMNSAKQKQYSLIYASALKNAMQG